MLPPYPKLVTTNTNVKVNQPQERSPEAYVSHILQLDVRDRRYARDEYGTKCNFYTMDVLHVMGYPVPLNQRAKALIMSWRAGQGPVMPMVIQDAVKNAQLGCPTVFGLEDPDSETWHVGVILPQGMPVTIGDLLVSNVGAINFYGRQLRYAVPRNRLGQVECFGAP